MSSRQYHREPTKYLADRKIIVFFCSLLFQCLRQGLWTGVVPGTAVMEPGTAVMELEAELRGICERARDRGYLIDFSDKVYGRGNLPNHHGVLVQLKPPGSDKREPKRFACTKADGPRPALEDCYSAAILWVKERVGVPAAPAEQLGPRAATTQELEWLHQWVDKQLAPEALTLEMCDAALEHMRAAAAGSCGFVRIQEAQLLRAHLATAERAMQRAAALHERLSAKVDVAAQ